MRLGAVFFDVGETLADEMRGCGARSPTRWASRGSPSSGSSVAWPRARSRILGVYEILGVERPESSGFRLDDLYPDAHQCLAELRAAGHLLGAVGNTGAEVEALLADLVDVVGSSARWGVEKPEPRFFARIVAELDARGWIAYVGDRVDNDVVPALTAGARPPSTSGVVLGLPASRRPVRSALTRSRNCLPR